MKPRVLTQPLSGNPLALDMIGGSAPADWYEERPRDAEQWRARLESIRTAFSADWLDQLSPAFQASGDARERLDAVSRGRGVVVTTGQQPGLFGGPVYTLSKALSVRALADHLERETGIPVAPVFWAATDDTDFREASATAIAVAGGARSLRMDHLEPLGRPMSEMPLGDVSAELDALADSVSSAADHTPLDVLRRCYSLDATVGSAYVSTLRELLAPLGIAVLDASHRATRTAARPVLAAALQKSDEIGGSVRDRDAAIAGAGFDVQVREVPGLSLVFTAASGSRKRIPVKTARKQEWSDDMGPNVLLRPVVERAILPTAAYVGGPAEIAYFAQVTPIADVIKAARPLIVPRWSCILIEPHVEKTLAKLKLTPEDFRDPHEAENRAARGLIPARVLREIDSARAAINEQIDALGRVIAAERAPISEAISAGLRANIARRLDRFERRLVVGVKRQNQALMTEIGTARGSLYPLGKPQERTLAFVQFLARYGHGLLDDMLTAAERHASALVGGRNAHNSVTARDER